jgi:hypothetical protein
MWRFLKRWPVLLAVLVAVGALAVAVVCPPHGSRVTRENCVRIKPGMSEAEVRAILGKPWDNSLLDPELLEPWVVAVQEREAMIRNRLQLIEQRLRNDGQWHGFAYWRLWIGKNFTIAVAFDPESRVAYTSPHAAPFGSMSSKRIWGRLRARYGW